MARFVGSVHGGVFAVAAVSVALSAAQGAVTYIGDTYIDGSGTDLSGLPSTLLEDGVSRQNALNGFGSGLAYAGGNSFYALSDRGPNKVVYPGGAAVDNTTSFDNRYQQFQITVTPSASLTGFTVSATNPGTTLLKNSAGVQYTGLSTGYTNTPNTRLDPEAIRVAPDGTTWITDEYGPYILHFDAAGNQIGALTPPPGFTIANPSPIGANEISGNTIGRVNNKGMEGMALTPDGSKLIGIMQSPLIQDGGTAGLNDRVVVYDLKNPTAAPKQFDYRLDSTSTSISDAVAINDHQILVDERNSTAGTGGIKKLYMIDLNQPGLTDLTGTAFAGDTATNGMPTITSPTGVTVLTKNLFADIGTLLNNAVVPGGYSPFTAVDGTNGLPDKIEGYSWGPDLPDGRHLLLVTNDNDFVQPGGAAGAGFPNYIFAFAVDPSDVPGFQAETFSVPEPASLSLMGLGVAGLLIRRRRQPVHS